MDRLWIATGAVVALLAVAIGALAAHTLKGVLAPAALETVETGARYQMYHALALIAVGLTAARWPGRLLAASAWLFLAGILLFAGSLYALAMTGVGIFGAITPFGGACFIAGWISFALAMIRRTA